MPKPTAPKKTRRPVARQGALSLPTIKDWRDAMQSLAVEAGVDTNQPPDALKNAIASRLAACFASNDTLTRERDDARDRASNLEADLNDARR